MQECRGVSQTGQAGVDAGHERPVNMVLFGKRLHEQFFRELQESLVAGKRHQGLQLSSIDLK